MRKQGLVHLAGSISLGFTWFHKFKVALICELYSPISDFGSKFDSGSYRSVIQWLLKEVRGSVTLVLVDGNEVEL